MNADPEKRLRVLISAYACEPGRGSEPAVGWNVAVQIARRHETWVLTRANNQPVIEAELRRVPAPHPHFVYLDLPGWARSWKRGRVGITLYYYLWQLLAYRRARALHREIGFDLTHHVTFVKYAIPSFLVRLPVPHIWGPVGGGESVPRPFLRDFSWSGRTMERLRDAARWLGEHDPFVRATVRGCAVALATTPETAGRLRELGAHDVRLCSQVGAAREDVEALQRPAQENLSPFRFISIGRLFDFKGVHLGLRAFARARIADAQYWIIGDGPARRRLEALARDLGVEEQVRFLGELPRPQVFEALRRCHVLIFPALHESGGWVCWEAMAAGCPVICLDCGGPALQVVDSAGFRVPVRNVAESLAGIAQAMTELAGSEALWRLYSKGAREHVAHAITWERKADALCAIYRSTVAARRDRG